MYNTPCLFPTVICVTCSKVCESNDEVFMSKDNHFCSPICRENFNTKGSYVKPTSFQLPRPQNCTNLTNTCWSILNA